MILKFRYSPGIPKTIPFTFGDLIVLVGLAAILYAGAQLALHTPAAIRGPDVSLSLYALPWYSFLSVLGMRAAYILSMIFSLAYGSVAARVHGAEKLLGINSGAVRELT